MAENILCTTRWMMIECDLLFYLLSFDEQTGARVSSFKKKGKGKKETNEITLTSFFFLLQKKSKIYFLPYNTDHQGNWAIAWAFKKKKQQTNQHWLKQHALKETSISAYQFHCTLCCVSCFELFMGLQGRAGERPLQQNNPTASRRCDTDNGVHNLPLWVLLTAIPPSTLWHIRALVIYVCMWTVIHVES